MLSAISPIADIIVVMVATNEPGRWNSLLAAAGTALVMQLDGVSQTFHEPPFVEWLAQEVDRSVIERTSPVFVVWATCEECPLYPQKRTWNSTVGMSALCQKRTLDQTRRKLHSLGQPDIVRWE